LDISSLLLVQKSKIQQLKLNPLVLVRQPDASLASKDIS
jgi:hypothetical protein